VDNTEIVWKLVKRRHIEVCRPDRVEMSSETRELERGAQQPEDVREGRSVNCNKLVEGIR
jgi:hypothetical protein